MDDNADLGAAALLLKPEAGALRRAAWVSVCAGLVWLPMAFCAAQAMTGLIRGAGLDIRWVLGFLALGLLRLALTTRAEALGQRAAGAALTRLRGDLLAHVARQAGLPRAGAFASLAGEQLALIRPYAFRYGPARLRSAVVPLAVLVCAFATAWGAGLILLIAGPAIPLFMALIGQAAGKASREQLDRMGSMGALLSDRVGALPDIRLLGAQGALAASFEAAAQALRRQTMRVLGIAFLSSTVLELFAALGIAMMAVFCGFSLLDQIAFGTWGAPLGITQALFLLLIAPEFFQPLRDLAAAWHDRAAADAAAGAMQRQIADSAMLPAASGGGLALRGVRHRGIAFDLELKPGTAIAITGPSGAGKTTLLRLLAGLENPDQGQVIRPDRVGWMPQSVHFLDDTLAANLRMGRDGDLTSALDHAAAGHLVAGLPDGLATRLGERGAGLSGGEGRRLTLARALHDAPEVILADEPTADLDAATAADVTRGLLAAHRAGATLVVATHDPTLVAALGREYRIGGA